MNYVNKPDYLPDFNLQKIFSGGLSYALIIGILIALFFLIFSGIQWIMSSGDKQKIEAARNRLTYALLGLVLLFLSFFIVNVVMHFFGVK